MTAVLFPLCETINNLSNYSEKFPQKFFLSGNISDRDTFCPILEFYGVYEIPFRIGHTNCDIVVKKASLCKHNVNSCYEGKPKSFSMRCSLFSFPRSFTEVIVPCFSRFIASSTMDRCSRIRSRAAAGFLAIMASSTP